MVATPTRGTGGVWNRADLKDRETGSLLSDIVLFSVSILGCFFPAPYLFYFFHLSPDDMTKGLHPKRRRKGGGRDWTDWLWGFGVCAISKRVSGSILDVGFPPQGRTDGLQGRFSWSAFSFSYSLYTVVAVVDAGQGDAGGIYDDDDLARERAIDLR